MQMSDSSIPQQLQKEEKTEEAMKAEEKERDEKRLCDYCNDAKALLYCRADSAKLCLSCDREVHSTNQLFSKHTRSQLCDACDSSPASIFCETEHSVLCQNCDWERHSLSLSSLHNRRPIEGFSGFPSASELLSILGFEDLGSEKCLFLSEETDGLAPSGLDGSGTLGEEYSDLLVWESPSVVSIDDLIVSSNSNQNFQAMGVPPLPKNRNAVCGQHKEEMLRQLREVARLEPFSCNGNADVKPTSGFQSVIGEENLQPQNMYSVCEPDAQPISFPGYEENLLHWCADNEELPTQVLLPNTFPGSGFDETSAVPNKRSGGRISHNNNGHDAQVHPVTPRTVSVLPKVGPHELNTQERDSAISRYKEKRKTRRYDKHIRYESRKVRAESRTRVKGRFAKMNH